MKPPIQGALVSASIADLRILWLAKSIAERCALRKRADLTCFAANLRISPSRLRHVSRAQVGFSPRKFLRPLRSRKARILLKRTSLSVKEVAARVDFNDLSHLFRARKELSGEPPSQTKRFGHRLR